MESTLDYTVKPVVEAPQATNDSDVVVAVRNVGKMYRLYDHPQDRLKEQLFWRFGKHYGREFWALRNISFEVHRGETVGIVGRNGSGKSTLLQIIAQTLTPTTGEIYVAGRVAALLELGSGFNPEFTGRENVFLNGSILGIAPEDMEERYEDIVAFADIGEFINQPVKIYSSGMIMRLAFAVQAHVSADVLIVDETLSVGDNFFQHKCMRRIKELVDQGLTLLFVSHSSDTVKRFCARGLWLESGQQRYFGDAGVAVEKYLAFMRMLNTNLGTAAREADMETEPSAERLDASNATIDSEVIPNVAREIDLSDTRLFPMGAWRWQEIPAIARLARYTSDPSALAAFRFQGDAVELAFVAGPQAGSVRVGIDGQDRVVDLYHPAEHRLYKIRFDVMPGKHQVTLGLVTIGGNLHKTISWLGGQVDMSARLEFRRDPNLSNSASLVERYGNQKGRLTAVELLDYVTEQPVSTVVFGQRLRLRLHAELLEPIAARPEFSFIVRDRNRIDLFGTTTVDEQVRLDPHGKLFVVEFAFDVRLGPGSYSILVAFVECSEDLSRRTPMDSIDIARVFTVNFDAQRPVWYMFHEPTSVRASTA
jgi:ABC-type polysaccharide/polyol phosphate transport system ATPase subunit